MKKFKVIVILILLVVAIAFIIHSYGALKEKFLNGFINRSVVSFCERKYKTKLFIGNIKGNIFTNIYLENILLERIKGLPEELQIKARSVRFHYNLIDLIRRNPKVEAQGLELRLGKIQLPLKFTQQGDVVTLVCDRRYLYLNQIEQVVFLKNDLTLKGLCELSGILVLKQFKPKLFDMQLICNNLEIIYGQIAKAKLNITLSLKGESSIPHLGGAIYVNEAEYYTEVGKVAIAGLSEFGVLDGFFIDVSVKGKDIKIKNKTLNTQVKADFKLRKEPLQKPYLVGEIESVKGTYIAYQNKFKITKGLIMFAGNVNNPAKMDMAAETRVSRYKISATVKGTLKDSRLELSSNPSLPRNEIVALLLFGRRIEKLDALEKKKLVGIEEMRDSLLAKLFLGKAEAKIAQVIGVDDFSVQPTINSQSPMQQIPSIEMGKYIEGDKLYGTYKIHPNQSIGQKPMQTAGGEYQINENIKVKGEHSFSDSIKVSQEDKIAIEFQWKF